ncbi:MAG: hypothetical protein ABEI52_01630, partial [Halobacteriaceae archaeon]
DRLGGVITILVVVASAFISFNLMTPPIAPAWASLIAVFVAAAVLGIILLASILVEDRIG